MLLKQGKLYRVKTEEDLYLYPENSKNKPLKINGDTTVLFLYEEPIQTVWEGSSPIIKFIYKCYFLLEDQIYYCLDNATSVLMEIT